jgi:F-type H+-transporting ATPase subunit b
MELVTPSLGLIFWTGLVFLGLLFVLTKFIWKPILKVVKERDQKIEDALMLADKTREEMKSIKAQNDSLLKEARAERDQIIKQAKETANEMIGKAQAEAKIAAEKEIANASAVIASEKKAAIADIKSQVASLSIAIAEKIVKEELNSVDKQTALASKLAEEINLN